MISLSTLINNYRSLPGVHNTTDNKIEIIKRLPKEIGKVKPKDALYALRLMPRINGLNPFIEAGTLKYFTPEIWQDFILTRTDFTHDAIAMITIAQHTMDLRPHLNPIIKIMPRGQLMDTLIGLLRIDQHPELQEWGFTTLIRNDNSFNNSYMVGTVAEIVLYSMVTGPFHDILIKLLNKYLVKNGDAAMIKGFELVLTSQNLVDALVKDGYYNTEAYRITKNVGFLPEAIQKMFLQGKKK